MDLRKVKPSRNFFDRTGEDRSKIDWTTQLGRRALENQGIPWEEGTKGLTPEQLRELLFQKVLEEYGGFYMNQFPPSPTAATKPQIYDKKYR